jgi:DNA-binding transcriptional regulator YiaG
MAAVIDLVAINAMLERTARDTTNSRFEKLPPVTGERIRSMRKELNMSQAEFAEYLGTSVSTIESWESGRRIPDTLFVLK